MGNISQDDGIQLVSLFLSGVGFALWLRVMLRSRRPLLFVPPLLALLSNIIFYLVIWFINPSINDATVLSASRTLQDISMWCISAVAMIWAQRRSGNL